jgi:hypothetical protein
VFRDGRTSPLAPYRLLDASGGVRPVDAVVPGDAPVTVWFVAGFDGVAPSEEPLTRAALIRLTDGRSAALSRPP